MKRLLLLSALLAQTAFAQDRLITKQGETIEVYNVEVSEKYVFFNKDKQADSAIERLKKEDVLLIKKENGETIELFRTDAAPAPASVEQAAAEGENVVLTTEALDAAAREANQALINKMNEPIHVTWPDEDAKAKKAMKIMAYMGVKSNSVVDNGELSIAVETGMYRKKNKNAPAEYISIDYTESFTLRNWYYNPAVVFAIKNKTNKVLYLDLGRSFYVRLGESICLYTPTATSQSSSSERGAGVNLGAVAGALNIGGVVGTLARGVNVGGSKGSSQTTMTYSKRVVPVPPLATVKLDPQYIFGNEPYADLNGTTALGFDYVSTYVGSSYDLRPYFHLSLNGDGQKLRSGEKVTFSEEQALLETSLLLTYSLSEDCGSTRTIPVHFYLKELIGMSISTSYKARAILHPNPTQGFGFWGGLKTKEDGDDAKNK